MTGVIPQSVDQILAQYGISGGVKNTKVLWQLLNGDMNSTGDQAVE